MGETVYIGAGAARCDRGERDVCEGGIYAVIGGRAELLRVRRLIGGLR